MFLTFLTAKLFETNAALIAMRGEPLYASGEIFQHESQRIPAAESCTGPVLLTGRVQPPWLILASVRSVLELFNTTVSGVGMV